MANIGFISLGCAKNQVDCERMMYRVQEAGHDVQADVVGCDVVVINTCGFIDSAKIVKRDSLGYVATTTEKFDIAFLDPPYEAGILIKALETVSLKMSDYGIIICEHPTEVTLPEEVSGFTVFKVYRYGKINVTVYKKV